MSNTNSHSGASSAVAMVTEPHDPFAILSDLEITLVLGYLSAQDAVCIRRVSTLWKARVDFRLSKAAIGRHFPGASEAKAVYANWEEEAVAFRRLARTYGMRSKPTIARKFEVQIRGSWCVCSHHLVWADDTHINIQRLQDPGNPTCVEFPIRRKALAAIKFEGQPWNVKALKVRWAAEDNKSGMVVLHLGLPFSRRRADPDPFWLLALSVATGKILWHQNYNFPILYPSRKRGWSYGCKSDGTFVSFGHGKLCFVDTAYGVKQNHWCKTHCTTSNSHDHFVVLNASTGKVEVRCPMPDAYWNLACRIVGEWGDCHAAHPTQEVYFLLMGQTLWVFSTRTGQLIHSRASPFGSPDKNLRVGVPAFYQGNNGQIWVWAEKGDSILSYEIELEKFRFSTPRVWGLAPNDNCVEFTTQKPWEWVHEKWQTQFDPAAGVVYVTEVWSAHDRETWRTMVVQFEPTEGTPNYHIRNCEFLTLPAKRKDPVAKVVVSESGTQGNSGERDIVELPNGRRHFRTESDVFYPWVRFFWTTGSYLTFEAFSAHAIYVFGFPP